MCIQGCVIQTIVFIVIGQEVMVSNGVRTNSTISDAWKIGLLFIGNSQKSLKKLTFKHSPADAFLIVFGVCCGLSRNRLMASLLTRDPGYHILLITLLLLS